MSTRLHLKCDGCDAETTTAPIRRRFVSLTGKSYGFGQWHEPDLDAAVEPTGWTWSDVIGCTYCPTCRASIEKGSAE